MQIVILLVYVVAIGAMMYFLAIKPQKKQQKQQQELMDSPDLTQFLSQNQEQFVKTRLEKVMPAYLERARQMGKILGKLAE